MGDEYKGHFSGLKPASRYHVANALSLAVACDLAYGGVRQIREVVRQYWNFPQIANIAIKKGRDIDTQCFVMADTKNVVVVFRGSDSVSDWLTNFQASSDPGPLKETRAHEGFQDALYPAALGITEALNKFSASNKKVWVTGHSLGGALASLYAGMLVENGFTIYGLYTFASPRPGSASFAEQLNMSVAGPHYRVVNHEDIVPHVPPEPFYSHPGNRIILRSHRTEKSSSSWFTQRKLALKKFIAMVGQKFEIADNHSLSALTQSYIPRLIRANARKRQH